MTTSYTHGITAGDIFYTSWGYEQTNTEFYQVTRASEASVWLREIARDKTTTGFMCGEVLPRPGEFVGEEFRRKIIKGRQNGSHVVNINSVAMGWQWNSEPKSVSTYA